MECKKIADYIVARCNDREEKITNLRLQKILYYVQGYFLKYFEQPAFNESIYCWPYGPVVAQAYYEYNINGNNNIILSESYKADALDKIKPKEYRQLINNIIDRCMNFTITNLVNKTHEELPWKNSDIKDEISISAIKNYFNENQIFF